MATATKASAAQDITTGAVEEPAGHIAHHLVSPVAQKWIEEGKQDPEGFWGRSGRPTAVVP